MSEHEHYVACLDLTGKRCVVVGDGEAKAKALRAAGAEVVVTDRHRPELLDDAWLVVCVDRTQGERVFADATNRRVFCNVEDVPELCTFILPALHRRGPITLAQWLRDRFAAQIGFEHEQLAYELRRIRPWVKQNFATYDERREYFRERVVRALAGVGSTEPATAEVPALPAPERATL